MTAADLDDLAATGDLAVELGVSNAAICNWVSRFADFPRPLVVLSTGPVYSRSQVRRWRESRSWQPGRQRLRS